MRIGSAMAAPWTRSSLRADSVSSLHTHTHTLMHAHALSPFFPNQLNYLLNCNFCNLTKCPSFFFPLNFQIVRVDGVSTLQWSCTSYQATAGVVPLNSLSLSRDDTLSLSLVVGNTSPRDTHTNIILPSWAADQVLLLDIARRGGSRGN